MNTYLLGACSSGDRVVSWAPGLQWWTGPEDLVLVELVIKWRETGSHPLITMHVQLKIGISATKKHITVSEKVN